MATLAPMHNRTYQRMKRNLSVLGLLSGVALAGWACAGAARESRQPEAAIEHIGREARATELFAAHCAVCHGGRGAGDGPAYPWLFPPPRDFTAGRFRLASTDNGIPSDEDLMRTLRRGIPGSAMPAWGWLPERDLEDLVWQVRETAAAGIARRLRADALAVGDSFAMRSAGMDARERVRPGRLLPPLGSLPDNPEVLERGRELYVRDCAGCHASDGSGDSHPRLDENGTLNWPRDFTAGFIKGGATPTELAWRIRTGLPGTAMPGFSFEPDELEALVAYVAALIPPGSDKRLVHERRTLRASRVDTLPTEPADPAWEGRAWTDVVLSPLYWNEEAVLGAELTAVHDGERVAIAVRWHDSSGGHRVFSDLAGPDGVALQFSDAEVPTLFGMGSAEHPTTIWHWQALRISEVAGALDLLQRPPHTVGEPFAGAARPDVPLYDRTSAIPSTATGADELEVAGVGEPIEAQSGEAIEAAPLWFDGRWTVVFTRELELPSDDRGPAQIDLRPGTAVQFALAAWNGAAGDRRGQKSISIWHELELER